MASTEGLNTTYGRGQSFSTSNTTHTHNDEFSSRWRQPSGDDPNAHNYRIEPESHEGHAQHQAPSSRFESTENLTSSPTNSSPDRSSNPAEERPQHIDFHLINDGGRHELQRIFTSLSQKASRRFSIAEPNDPRIDPTSDAFDLSKFLRSFRYYIESEGVEMKQLSVVYKSLNVYGSGAALQLQRLLVICSRCPFVWANMSALGTRIASRSYSDSMGSSSRASYASFLAAPAPGAVTCPISQWRISVSGVPHQHRDAL
jgi:hypothetical protein